MRIIFSRKGFDTGAGGVPSPILANRPISLPIPQNDSFGSSYAALGLGHVVTTLTKGRVRPDTIAHHDPQFHHDIVHFGQAGAAQAHLDNQGVEVGDLFVFFGLFCDREAPSHHPNARPHHRIFGWMRAAYKNTPQEASQRWPDLRHPHFGAERTAHNDTLWSGPGNLAHTASAALRLSVPGGPPSRWQLPPWIAQAGMSYHSAPERWLANHQLQVVARGQEFVVPPHPCAHAWAQTIIAACAAPPA